MSSKTTHPDGKRILAWMNGELSEREFEAVQRHCEGCPSCSELRRELARVTERLTELSPPPPLRAIWPEVRDRLERDRRPIWRPAFTAAAAVTAVAGVLLGLYIGSLDRRAPAPEASYLWSYISSSLTDAEDRAWPNVVSTDTGKGR